MTAQSWAQLVERIDTQARQLQPREVLLSLIFVVPFVVGWLAARALAGGWIVVAWVWSAGLAGWQQAGGLHGRKPPGPPP
jgi:hypothetical protein